MSRFQATLVSDGRMHGQALIYKTLLVKAGGPKPLAKDKETKLIMYCDGALDFLVKEIYF